MSAFQRLADQLDAKPGVRNPRALAAAIGRKKLGEPEMARRSAAGRRRHTAADVGRQLAGK